MTLTGPPPTFLLQQLEPLVSAPRLQQRITADVLRVQGDHVWLEVQGVPVVARLTSPGQSAELIGRRTAQFVVDDTSSEVIGLRLVKTQPAELAAQPIQADFIPRLLEHAGLPASAVNIEIARALLEHGLPVTLEIVEEFQDVLEAIGGWGEPEAQSAAALKAAGLPLSPAGLALSLNNLAPLAEALGRFMTRLRAESKGAISPRLAAAIMKILTLLEGAVINQSASPAEIADQLRHAVSIWGRSLEKDLGTLVPLGGSISLEQPAVKGLLALASLPAVAGEELPPERTKELLGAFNQLIEAARAMQFPNADPDPQAVGERWLRIILPIAFTETTGAESLDQAELLVAYTSEDGRQKIDPAQTRLVLRMTVGDEAFVQTDISIMGQRIGLAVTVPNQLLGSLAENELPGLEAGLHELGYVLKAAHVTVDDGQQTDHPNNHLSLDMPVGAVVPLSRVDLEA